MMTLEATFLRGKSPVKSGIVPPHSGKVFPPQLPNLNPRISQKVCLLGILDSYKVDSINSHT